MLERGSFAFFNMREERWDSKNIRVREERERKADDGSRTKIEKRKLRSMQRDYGGDNAYKCISRITSTRTLQTSHKATEAVDPGAGDSQGAPCE